MLSTPRVKLLYTSDLLIILKPKNEGFKVITTSYVFGDKMIGLSGKMSACFRNLSKKQFRLFKVLMSEKDWIQVRNEI
ncbi:hypothetical protein HI914_01994 [Erysiphe necator]|nr:hypothetical protein HI914_01994 [Erysiphe necator]